MEELYIVSTHYFYAGIVVLQEGKVTRTAPILKWMKGLTIEEAQRKAPPHYRFEKIS